eukprot:scaffold21754_cov34-Phaeocystis_antarctica.AAC.1
MLAHRLAATRPPSSSSSKSWLSYQSGGARPAAPRADPAPWLGLRVRFEDPLADPAPWLGLGLKARLEVGAGAGVRVRFEVGVTVTVRVRVRVRVREGEQQPPP